MVTANPREDAPAAAEAVSTEASAVTASVTAPEADASAPISPIAGAPLAEDVTSNGYPPSGDFRWLKMETGISGPDICLSRGDKHPFNDVPAPDGGPSEAQRLIDAGFAVETDPPAGA